MATKTDADGWFSGGRAKWLVVLAGFCILFVVKGTVATYGVFIDPIESDFGWSRTTVSLTFAIYLLATAVASPVAGRVIDSYGPRRTFPVVIAAVALTLVALSAISAVSHLYALYGLLGFAITGIANSHFSSVVTKWFDSGTLLASGIVISGFSLGQLVFNPVSAEIILQYDWRRAYLVYGLLCLVMVPVAYFLVKRPGEAETDVQTATPERADGGDPAADADESADGADTDAGAGAATETNSNAVETISEALRAPALWLLVVTFFICGFTTIGLMTTHLVPYLLSVGFAESVAAQGAGIRGGMTVFGLISMGVVGDRLRPGLQKRTLLAGIYLLRAVTLATLLFVSSVLGLFVFASVYGFLTLCTVPLHADITADAFGREHLTTLVGIQYAGHQVGGASAALAAGWIFDAMGSYRPAHLIGVGLLLVAPLLVLGDRVIDPRV
jgi:MFS family permease